MVWWATLLSGFDFPRIAFLCDDGGPQRINPWRSSRSTCRSCPGCWGGWADGFCAIYIYTYIDNIRFFLLSTQDRLNNSTAELTNKRVCTAKTQENLATRMMIQLSINGDTSPTTLESACCVVRHLSKFSDCHPMGVSLRSLRFVGS